MQISKIDRVEVFQYNGSNSGDVVDWLNSYSSSPTFWSVISEGGGELVLDRGGNEDKLEIPVNGYAEIRRRSGDGARSVPDSEVDNHFYDLEEDILDLIPAPAVLITSTGQAALPASVLGGQQVIDVTIAPELPGTDFEPHVELRGSSVGLLAGHVVTSTENLDEETVRVTIQSGATAPAGTVRVVAYALEEQAS